MNVIEITKEGGLICDNKHCDYTNEVPSENCKDWIDRPCPKCGENLLTKKDYNQYLALLKAVKIINWFGRLFRIKAKPEDMKVFSVHGHNGKVTIKGD